VARADEVFSRLSRQRPDDPYLWIGRGRHNALQSRWKEAAASYARGVKAREPSIDWFEYAAALCLAGDSAGYRDFVTWATGRAGTSADPYTALVLARMSGIVPGSPVAPSRAVGWAEQSINSEDHPLSSCILGLAHYRAGRYQEAIRKLEETETKRPEKASSAQSKLVLAMAYFRLEDLAAARGSLARAIAAIPDPNTEGLAPADWLAVQVLRREAENLIPRTSEPAKPPGDR
jgi:tetratricopeptide (TPR) repeat protein